ncbi:hypothetical protein [Acutalibacter sp. 1XD8-33]|nr:hypothetical protein [Acutalibacter sp. 1XD8-33]
MERSSTVLPENAGKIASGNRSDLTESADETLCVRRSHRITLEKYAF